MTIICAYRDAVSGEVWIGSDSRATGGDDFICPVRARKLMHCGPWVIGVAGSAMNARIIADLSSEIAEMEHAEQISARLMEEFKERDYKRDDREGSSGPPNYEQELLITNKNEVWWMACDGAVADPDGGFVAIGGGCQFAYGAAFAVMEIAKPGEMLGRSQFIIETAVKAAIQYCASCGGNVVVERVM